MKISNLSNREFKIMIIKIVTEVRKTMHEQNDIFSLPLDSAEESQSLLSWSDPSVYSITVEIPASARTGLSVHWDTLGSKTDGQPSLSL